MNILERDWHSFPGASGETIERLTKVVAVQLPESYLSLLRLTNGGEGPLSRQPFHLQLDTAETVLETTVSRTHEDFFPGFLVIGSNGGGEFIAFDTRMPGVLPVVALDMTNADLTDSVMPIASDFDAFLEFLGIEASD